VIANLSAGKPIIWLASYPKSGNTWLRAMLTALCLPPGKDLALDEMVGRANLFDRQAIDDFAAVNSSELTVRELTRILSRYFSSVAARLEPPAFFKTHAACLDAGGERAFFPADTIAGAVYLVRDPRDVAVSYAYHDGLDHDAIVARMADPEATFEWWPDRCSENVPQVMSTWSEHVRSWTQNPDFPVLGLRYEDMLVDPLAALNRIARFCMLDRGQKALEQAVRLTEFSRLQQLEQESRFTSKPKQDRAFFRSGQSGDWRKDLNSVQISRIERDHAGVMKLWGYIT